jgi:hypothetical protein
MGILKTVNAGTLWGHTLLPSSTIQPMANRIRSARSASQWTRSELVDYRIRTVDDNVRDFFRIHTGILPDATVDDIILNNLHEPAGIPIPDQVQQFFALLYEVDPGDAPAGPELDVDAFSHHLLEISNLVTPGREVELRQNLPFIMSGQGVSAMPDVVLRSLQNHIILVQEDKVSNGFPILSQPHISDTATRAKRKQGRSHEGVEPQLVAQAVGAFRSDNRHRIEMGLPPFRRRGYMGIIMIGTAPYFYKIQITERLKEAIECAESPMANTILHRFIPIEDAGFLDDGMVPLHNRRVCFQCFEALRTFLVGQ